MVSPLQRLVPAVRGAAGAVAGVEVQVLVGGDERVGAGAVALLQGRVQAVVPDHANLAQMIRKLVREDVEGVRQLVHRGGPAAVALVGGPEPGVSRRLPAGGEHG